MVSLVPSRSELDALLAQREGELRAQPYRLLLLAIAVREASGVLTLRRGPLEKEVVFDAGAAVDCQSNIATETVGRFLVSSGRLADDQYRDALSTSAARGVPLEELLTERGFIAQADLVRAHQQNLGRKLLEPFSWTSGSWHFSLDAPAAEPGPRVRVPQLLVTGIGKIEPLETIEAALHDAGLRQLAPGRSPLFPPSELRLSEEQQRILAAIERRASLDELRRSSHAPEDLDRFVFALLLLGCAEPADAMPVEAPAAAPEPAAAVPFFELDLDAAEPPRRAPAPVTRPESVAVTTHEWSPAPVASAEEVAIAHLVSRGGDAFELLGLDPQSGAVEIARAFTRLAERFLPTRFSEESGHREKAQEVFLAAARAYAELADPTRRQALIDRRRPERQETPAPPAAPARPATPAPSSRRPAPAKPRRAIIDPEELCREGRAASAAGNLRDALGYFEMAADCDAQNGTYAAEAAWCRYQLLISPAPTTVKALKNAVRIDPRCGVAYLYLGKIQEALGNHMEAQAYLGRASTLGHRG